MSSGETVRERPQIELHKPSAIRLRVLKPARGDARERIADVPRPAAWVHVTHPCEQVEVRLAGAGPELDAHRAVRLTTAVAAAVVASAAMIMLEEVVAGVRAELSTQALVAQTAVGALFGLLVIALEVVLH